MSLMGQLQKVNLPTAEAQVIPSEFGGIVSKAARQTWLNFNSTSSDAAMAEADEWQAEQYKAATGDDISELYPTPQEYKQAFRENRPEMGTATGRRDFVNKKIDAMRVVNPGMFRDVPTSADQTAKAADIANKSTRDLEEAQYFTRSNWPGLATFTGGMGGALLDPVNLATMPLGGGGKTVIQLMMREALIGAGTELALQPAIMKWQKTIGQQYGLTEAATNVVFGAVGAAGLSGMFRGASVAYNKLSNHYIDSDVLNAGFKQLSIDAHLKENDPSITIYGSKTHLEAVDFGQRALEFGFMPEVRTVSRGNELAFEQMTIGEKAEYAGLDMSSESRLSRAKEQGYSEQVYYHGTSEDITGFTLPPEGTFGQLGKGIYLTSDAAKASGYPKADGGNVIPTVIKGRLAKNEDVNLARDELGDEVQGIGHNKQMELINEKLQEKGFAGIDAGQEIIVFDPKNIRSANDAFDPAQAGSSKLIADDFAEPDIPRPTEYEYSNFQQVLTDNEIFPELRSKDDIGEQLDSLESPEVEAAALTDFERNVEANGDDIIYMDDGTMVNIRDLQAKFKEDEQMLEAITSCSIGGGE